VLSQVGDPAVVVPGTSVFARLYEKVG
jgi:hypothetical protein